MLELALLVVAVAVVVAAGVFVYGNRPQVLARRVRSRVVVTLKDGGAFQGVLVDADAQTLVLHGAVALGEAPLPVDGEVVVFTADVAYLQKP
jgi:small nuclear ribonucleoprotein (snRNP)-like protein